MTQANTPMAPGGYGQLCSVALALDKIGDRWTLLILRDLARSPLRFRDLQAINPGISPSLLTQRLRRLESASIIERQTTPPAQTTVYALAESSRTYLVPVLTALADLGAHFLESGPLPDDPVDALVEQFRRNGHFVVARGSSLHGYFVLDMSGWLIHIAIGAEGFQTSREPLPDRSPDGTAMFFPPTTLMRIMGRCGTVEQAEALGLATIDGDRDRVLELIELLSFASYQGDIDDQ